MSPCCTAYRIRADMMRDLARDAAASVPEALPNYVPRPPIDTSLFTPPSPPSPAPPPPDPPLGAAILTPRFATISGPGIPR